MKVDFSKLDAAIADDLAQVAATETVEASAVALIDSFSAQVQTEVAAAVSKALEDEDASVQQVVDAAVASVQGVNARYKATGDKLGASVAQVTPPPPPTGV